MAERKSISFRVPMPLYTKLKQEHEKTDVPIQKILERALEEYLRKKRGA